MSCVLNKVASSKQFYINMNKAIILIIITGCINITALGETCASYFFPLEKQHIELACIGAHPDSIAGSYFLYDSGGSGHIASLELYSNGSFVCSNNFGVLFASYGHWDMLDSTHLNLNTGSRQIEIEEMYVKNTTTPGKYHFYCLEEITNGYYNRLSDYELLVSMNGKIRKLRSDEKGELSVKSDYPIDSITVTGCDGRNLVYSYTVKNPNWSNVFIIKCPRCLYFNNIQWDLVEKDKWCNNNAFGGYVLKKNQSR